MDSKQKELLNDRARTDRVGLSRRGFLGSLAAGLGASAIAQSGFGNGYDLEAQTLVPPGNVHIVSGPTNVLSPADFRYEGSVGLPHSYVGAGGDGCRFGFSNGAMSGRVVNGDIHLFMCQTNPSAGGWHDEVAEVRFNGFGQRTTLLNNWGDVTKGRRVNANTGGQPIRGLHWDPVTNQLWWAYGIEYAGNYNWDPSIGTSVLTGIDNSGVTAFGPWRTGVHSQKSRGYLYALPASMQGALGGKRMAVGAPITSGNSTSPFGAYAAAFAPPSNSLPASVTANNTVAIPTTDLIFTDIDHRQARPGDTDQCGWAHYGQSDSLGAQPQNNTVQNGNGCTVNGQLCGATPLSPQTGFTTLDMFTAATWIDGASKQGVVYIGQICRTLAGQTYAGNGRNHVTYGPTQGANTHLCVHGQNHYTYCNSTGDSTQTMMSALYIYNPSDLLAVARGAKSAVSVTPATDAYDMSQLVHVGAPFPQIAGGLFRYGGCWFEPQSKMLFVSETNAEGWASEGQPIIHIFSVDC